jgi:DNA helicase-2/ATP-dependent DNA helicase PcrA
MSFLNQVNTKQLEAIKSVQGPVIVIAGPGSGKTRVLTFRIAHLINIGVPAYQILALTFTNKAGNEIKERITKLVGEKSKSVWMGTFHSIFARLLRIESEKLGYGKNFSIYDTQDSVGLVKNIMNDLGIPAQHYNPRAVLSTISSAKNQLITPEVFQEQASGIFEEKAGKIWIEYKRRLKHNNGMDFDDLLLKPIELFNHHKNILESYQDRFRFILIDEYQDTNHAQYVLINLLAQKYRNICVVGDDAQSIYAFRGADIRNILEFEKDYPDSIIIRLEQNYRSTKTILKAADGLIKNNVDQIPKNLWTENNEGEKVTLLQCDDDTNEGGSIVRCIFDESNKNKLQFKDFAIMYRTNAQSRSLEDSLRKNSVPYSIIGGVEFYLRKEVKDVLAYLRLLVNPNDDESFLRIVNYPSRGIGAVAVNHLKKYAASKSLNLLEAAEQGSEILGISVKGKKTLGALAVMLKKYQKLRSEISISETSRALVDEIGILHLFKEEGTPEALARWENVQELLSAISEFSERNSEATLENFLQDVSLVSDVDHWEDKLNAVTLMTLHSAKGLEFPVVFIAGLEEGLLPFYSSDPDRKDIEEERRLLYVGFTRAMSNLFLSYARVRFRFGEMSYQTPSRFIDEIDVSLIETKKQTSSYFVSESMQRKKEIYPSKRKKQKKVNVDSTYFSDEMPDYDSASIEKLQTGILVEHDIFGKGKILHLAGSGDSLKAVVDFSSVGKKNLMLKYARLKIL